MSLFEAMYSKTSSHTAESSLSSTASSSRRGSSSSAASLDLSVSPVSIIHVTPSSLASPEKESVSSNSSSSSTSGILAVLVSSNPGKILARALEPPLRVSTDDDEAVFNDVPRGIFGNVGSSANDVKTRTQNILFGSVSNHSSDTGHEDLTEMITTPSAPARRPSRDKRRKSSRSRRSITAADNTSCVSHSILMDDYENNRAPVAVRRRASQRELSGGSFGGGSTYRSSSQQILNALSPTASLTRGPSDDINNHCIAYATPEISSESSPDCSPSRMSGGANKEHQHHEESQQHRNQIPNSSSFSRTSPHSVTSNNSSSNNDLSLTVSRLLPRGGSGSSSSFPKFLKRVSSKSLYLSGTLLCMVVVSLAGTLFLTNHASPIGDIYEVEHSINRPDKYPTAAGLRGKIVQGRWDDNAPTLGVGSVTTNNNKNNKLSSSQRGIKKPKAYSQHNGDGSANRLNESKSNDRQKANGMTSTKAERSIGGTESYSRLPNLEIHLPPPLSMPTPYSYDKVDPYMYGFKGTVVKKTQSHTPPPRVISLDPSVSRISRKIEPYPADFTDNTQLYGILPSDDERLSRMEIRSPYSQGECVPMQDWQTTFHPLCNGMHELPLQHLGNDSDGQLTTSNDHNNVTTGYTNYYGRLNAHLFGTKGFWRYAWRLHIDHVERGPATDTVVLKTLKFEHNFEDAHFEHDRVDAVAMERLTSSPHVINVFGFCGHSVLTEYADGSSVGELADKARKRPLERLRIARDIANGLADVHGIDGDGNATFVHLDINPANVVSIGGNLKLNDFNIGIIRKWNMTSNEPCGFPAQYPNPQWRSPEEARNEQNLTEKVDIFSMGHIFFRLICGHEPWNRFEPDGKPSKEEINRKVQLGIMPHIPDDVRNSEDPEVIAIRDAMISCYSKDPEDRPSAREISKSLDQTLKELSKSSTFSNSVGAEKSRRFQK